MVFVRNPDGSVANTTAIKHIDPERVAYSVREPVFIGESGSRGPKLYPASGKPVDVGVFKDPEDIKSMPRLLEPVEIGEYKNPKRTVVRETEASQSTLRLQTRWLVNLATFKASTITGFQTGWIGRSISELLCEVLK